MDHSFRYRRIRWSDDYQRWSVMKMQAARGENRIELLGRVVDRPVLSHQNHGTDYYIMPLAVPRLSGTEDVLNLVLSRWQLERWALPPGNG